jgi:PAS domain S-box-containing protein
VNLSLRLLPRSLVGRVFALYTVTLLAFVVGGLALFYRYQFTVELEDAQLRADTLVEVIMPTISDSAVIGDYDTIHRTLERALLHSSFSMASYIDLQGGLVRAPRHDTPDVAPPRWLVEQMAARLYDTNQPVKVGGRDYGVLRLSFAPELIAGRLWEQTRMALVLAVLSVAGGLLLIRFPLVHWLGNLSRIQDFERAMQTGKATPDMLMAEDAPTEFRATFEVLGRTVQSLQAQRAQAAVTLSAIADSVYTLDGQGRVVFANPAACALAGRTLVELLGQSATEVLPAVYRDVDPLGSWTGRRATLSAVHGREVVVDTTQSAILAPDGAVAGHVLACRDISEQHALDLRLRAELQSRATALISLRQVLEGLICDTSIGVEGADDLEAVSMMIFELVGQLQERGEQLNAIFALSPDGFISFDARRRANYVSPAFSRLTGLAEPQVLGAEEAQIEAMLRERFTSTASWRGFEAMRRDLPEAAGDAKPRRELIDLAWPKPRVLEAGLRLGTTDAISQVLSLRDVTHETEVDQMKSEFLSTAAHELRTPMASIYGFSELMSRRKLSPEQQSEVISTIHRQSELMISIVNELLDLARIEARRGKDFTFEVLDLATLLPELLQEFRPPQERCAPGLYPIAPSIRVRVDRNKMRQAVGNVLANAYKYSPGGGEVKVDLVHDDGDAAMVGIRVRDHGIGLTAEQLSRVGERFYRADASGNIPGTGLGVSIVKEIIELMGGRLAIASEPGQGTAVTLWLPVTPEVAPADVVMEPA